VDAGHRSPAPPGATVTPLAGQETADRAADRTRCDRGRSRFLDLPQPERRGRRIRPAAAHGRTQDSRKLLTAGSPGTHPDRLLRDRRRLFSEPVAHPRALSGRPAGRTDRDLALDRGSRPDAHPLAGSGRGAARPPAGTPYGTAPLSGDSENSGPPLGHRPPPPTTCSACREASTRAH